MKSLFFFLFILLSFLFTTKGFSQEITLFDKDGNATSYVDYSNNVIYSWRGNPEGYIAFNKNNYYNVYAFNGEHMGWFEEGKIRNHDGEVMGFIAGSVSTVITKIEPPKGQRRLAPQKSIEKLEPVKPIYKLNFSIESLSAFLNKYAPDQYSSLGTTNVIDRRTNYDVYKVPLYQPNWDLINQVATTLQQKHNALLAQGFVYDEPSQTYIHRDNLEQVYKERKDAIDKSVIEYKRTFYFKENKVPVDGWHVLAAYSYTQQHPILYYSKVKIIKGKLYEAIFSITGNYETYKAVGHPKIERGVVVASFKKGFAEKVFITPQMMYFISEVN